MAAAVADPAADRSVAVAAVAAGDTGNPGGNQLPLTHVQSGPGFTVGHYDGGGSGGGGGSVGGGSGGGGGGGGGPPGIGNPGGNQLPLKHVQSGPGFIVVHDEEGGGGGGGGGGGVVPSKAIL